MACTSPIPAIDLGIDEETGKRRIKIKYPHINESLADFRRRFGDENVLLLPCGHCLSCQLARRKEWAVRCTLESLYHLKKCFVTLTYSPIKYVDDMKAVKRDFQAFIRSLRDSLDFHNNQLRYFGCIERGGRTNRLHMHICLFGFAPSDLHQYSRSDSDHPMFKSEYLENLWNKGFVMVEDFGYGVGNYIAGYTAKKVGTSEAVLLMSKRPGIGYQYLEDHQLELSQALRIIDDLGDIKVADIPRYFEKICEKNGVDISDVKNANQIVGKHGRDAEMQIHKYSHEEFIFKNHDFLKRKKTQKAFVRGN